MLTIFLIFLIYLHEAKVNYRKFLEEQFITEVREITYQNFRKDNTKYTSEDS